MKHQRPQSKSSEAEGGPLGTPPRTGCYMLLLRLWRVRCLRVGALGPLRLAPGCYVYTGSAKRNLSQRVQRHLRSEKRVRWHIDYLTTAHGVARLGAVVFWSPQVSECTLSRALAQAGWSAPVLRFGASDCRQSCPAHLWRNLSCPELSELAQLAQLAQLAAPTGQPWREGEHFGLVEPGPPTGRGRDSPRFL